MSEVNALIQFEPRAVALDSIETLEISGPETMEIAILYREDVKALLKEIDSGYRQHIANAHKSHADLCAELRRRSEYPAKVLSLLNDRIAAYELDRQQREERAQREAEALELLQAAERRKADAETVAAAGDHKTALAIAAAPIEEFAQPVVQQTRVESRVGGVAVRQSFVPELTDLAALVKFAATQGAVMQAVVVAPNLDGLQLLMDQMGSAFSIPGVKRVPGKRSVRSSVRKR